MKGTHICCGLLAIAAVNLSSAARADLIGTSLTNLNGTGFGNVTSLLAVQATQGGTETGGVSWNGSQFVGSGDTKGCCSGPQTQVVTIGSLGWTSGENVGLVVNFNTAGTQSGAIDLTALTLSLFDPTTHNELADFSINQSYHFTNEQVQQGTGQSGWLFTLDGAQQAAFNAFAINPDVLAGISLATLTNPTDGPDNVFALNTQAVPGPIVGAGLPGLVVACGGLLALARRRRSASLA